MASDVGAYIAIIVSVLGFTASVFSVWFTNRNRKDLDEHRRKLDEEQRRKEHAENIEKLMKQYKKPLIQSAFELQSKLKEQVSRNLLNLFSKQGEQRENYALFSTVFLFCEFLGWLEIIRREVVFIMGEKAGTLNQIIDDIKFQFTGETLIQGVKNKNVTTHSGDVQEQDWTIMQILGVDLRAIGEAMSVHRTYDDTSPNQTNTGLEVIGYSEFVSRYKHAEWLESQQNTAESTTEANIQIKKFKDSIEPLKQSVKRLMGKQSDAPTERITVMQVLLCKLIDVLDDGGQKGYGEQGGQFLSRNHRITPMVAKLSAPAQKWLAGRPYMKHCENELQDADRENWRRLTENGDVQEWVNEVNAELGKLRAQQGNLTPLDLEWCEEFKPEDLGRLAFPGFRADLDNSPEKYNNKKEALGVYWFPGAFPQRQDTSEPPHLSAATTPAVGNGLESCFPLRNGNTASPDQVDVHVDA